MKCNFRVGQKVTMVRNFGPESRRRAREHGVTIPTKGQTYTVRFVELPEDQFDFECLRFEEIKNGPFGEYAVEPTFDSDLFEPVAEVSA